MIETTYLTLSTLGEGLDQIFLYKRTIPNLVFGRVFTLNTKEKGVLRKQWRIFQDLRLEWCRHLTDRRQMDQTMLAANLHRLFSALGQLQFMYSVYKFVYHYIHWKDGAVSGGHSLTFVTRSLPSVFKNRLAMFHSGISEVANRNVESLGLGLGMRHTLLEWSQTRFEDFPEFQYIFSKEDPVETLELAAYTAEVSYWRMQIKGYNDEISNNYHALYYLERIRDGTRDNLAGLTGNPLVKFTEAFCVIYMDRKARQSASYKPIYSVRSHYSSILRAVMDNDTIRAFFLDEKGPGELNTVGWLAAVRRDKRA